MELAQFHSPEYLEFLQHISPEAQEVCGQETTWGLESWHELEFLQRIFLEAQEVRLMVQGTSSGRLQPLAATCGSFGEMCQNAAFLTVGLPRAAGALQLGRRLG